MEASVSGNIQFSGDSGPSPARHSSSLKADQPYPRLVLLESHVSYI